MYKTVAEFYNGQSVFVTGATGFLGKVFLEKLLYSCPKIDKIYILIREQKNLSIQERLHSLREEPIFWRSREEAPNALEKIIPIMGDVNLPKMGIKDEDAEILIKNVSIVFHIAATVNLKLKLEVAVNTNTIGTERVLHLIQRMEKIKCFIYVSTAYFGTDIEVFEEAYPEPISIEEMKKILKTGLTKEKVNKLIEGRANTYTFSKALAETLVINNHGSIPSIIIRPSIVASIKSEPIVGWLDNQFGATGFMRTIYQGFSRVLRGQNENIIDLIPVDYVSNLMIVAASKCESSKEVKFYNSATSVENPLTMYYFLKRIIEYSYKYKAYIIPMPIIFVTRFKWLVSLVMLLEKVPAYLLDMFLFLGGNNSFRYSHLAEKAIRIRNNLQYFTERTWKIHASKTRALSDSLSPSDKRIFPFDPKDIVWKDYIFSYCHGIRQFLKD